jgi:hypothetical protein
MSGSTRHKQRLYRVVAILFAATLLAGPVSHASARTGASTMATAPRASIALSSRTLIEARLLSGAIDYPTSLVYRAYALFGDPRLPADLAGSGATVEDDGLFREIPYTWDKLPRKTQDLLTPFIVRPTDPRSRFFSSRSLAADAPAASAQNDGECQDGWISRDSGKFPYKLWMHCTGDYDRDFDEAIGIIDGFWEREVALMGEPLPDGGSADQGGDTRIDIYFVDDESDLAPRRGGISIDPSAAAFATADEPVVGTASSAFVVARRPFIGKPQLSLTLAHEFFHVLQYAQNWEIGFGFQGTPYSADFDILSLVEVWFVEASADWMKSYIYRDTMPAEVMQTYLHYRFTEYFQGVDLPLTFSTTQADPLLTHEYASYVYFLFMEQELGPQAVADFWKALRDVKPDDFDRMTKILDSLLPFKDHFRDFAVRNFNLDLKPGNPISPRYQDIDPTFPILGPELNFAKGVNGRLPLLNPGDAPKAYDESLNYLTAHYYYFSPAADATAVTFDFSGLAPNDVVDVDAIVKIKDGGWERRQLATDGPVTFCRDVPEDSVENLYLVVSNHDWHTSTTVTGTFTAGAYDEACA